MDQSLTANDGLEFHTSADPVFSGVESRSHFRTPNFPLERIHLKIIRIRWNLNISNVRHKHLCGIKFA